MVFDTSRETFPELTGKQWYRTVGFKQLAIRKKLGLRNSSNRGEKANDLVVSFRQKHNGMSWSQQGSFALSTLDTLVRNDNHQPWFEQRTVDFRLAA